MEPTLDGIMEYLEASKVGPPEPTRRQRMDQLYAARLPHEIAAYLEEQDKVSFRGVGNAARGVGQSIVDTTTALGIQAPAMLASEIGRFLGDSNLLDPSQYFRKPGAGDPRATRGSTEGVTGVLGAEGVDTGGATPAQVGVWNRNNPSLPERAAELSDRIRRDVAQLIPYERSDGLIAGVLEDTVRSAPTTVVGAGVGVGVGAATRNPGLGLTAGSIFMALADASGEMDQTYRDAVASGETPADAARIANRVGAIYAPTSAALERIGLRQILNIGRNVPGKNRLFQVAKRVAEAGTTEFITEAMQTSAAEAIRGVITDDFEDFKTLWTDSDELLRAGISGFLLGGGIRTAGEILDPNNYKSGKKYLEAIEAAKVAAKPNARTLGQAAGGTEAAAPGMLDMTRPYLMRREQEGERTPERQREVDQTVRVARASASDGARMGLEALARGNDLKPEDLRVVDDRELDEEQRAEVEYMAGLGTAVVFVDYGGKPMPLRGAVNPTAGVIVIDKNLNRNEMVAQFAWHELVHDFERRDPGGWKRLEEALQIAAPELMKRAKAAYEANTLRGGKTVSDAVLEREGPSVVAERVIEAIKLAKDDPAALGRLLTTADPTLIDRLISAIQAALRHVGLFDQERDTRLEAIKKRLAQKAKLGKEASTTGGNIGKIDPNEVLNAAAAIFDAVQDLRPFLEPQADTQAQAAQATPEATATPSETPEATDAADGVQEPQDDQADDEPSGGGGAATVSAPTTVAPPAVASKPKARTRTDGPRAKLRPRNKTEFSSRAIKKRLEEIVEDAGAETEAIQASWLTGQEGLDASEEYIDTNFSGRLPSEIREGLQGYPPNVRTYFKGNVPGGAGEGVMAAIGSDEMIRRVGLMVEGKKSRVQRYMDESSSSDFSNLSPDAGMLAAVLDSRGAIPADKQKKIQVVENPGELPQGATFRLQGNTWVVDRSAGYAEAVSERGDRFNLDGVEAMPIDSNSLRKQAGAEVPNPTDPLDDLPFAVRAALDVARKEYADYRSSSEEEFFHEHWPMLLKKGGLNRRITTDEKGGLDQKASAKAIQEAAAQAVDDIIPWLEANQKFQNYYHSDMKALRKVLDIRFRELNGGKRLSSDQFTLFRAFIGITSPNTILESNVMDALVLFEMYLKEGNFDRIRLTPNGTGLLYSPVTISGNTSPNKIRVAKVITKMMADRGWTAKKTMEYLAEGVTVTELHKFNREMGYAGAVGKIGDVKRVVWAATGQEIDKDMLIPRMFIFGPKVGAYTLNAIGNDRYTTTDIWESRYVRSHFDGLFDENTGMPETPLEHDLFQSFSIAFMEEMKKRSKEEFSPAALQAVRWFYILGSSLEAGYTKARTNQTISESAAVQSQRMETAYVPSGRETKSKEQLEDENRKKVEAREKKKQRVAASQQSARSRSAEPAFAVRAPETPEFKRWFGDSKVVDEQGRPLVVYHGSNSKFNTFEQRKGTVSVLFSSYEVDRAGFFFSPVEDVSRSFGSVVRPFFLSVQNPADFTPGQMKYRPEYPRNLSDPEVRLIEEKGYPVDFFKRDAWEWFDTDDQFDAPYQGGPQLVRDLADLGYDGAMIEEPLSKSDLDEYGIDDYPTTYIAFGQGQIKSATENSGAFDAANPDIRFAVRAQNEPGFKAWFGYSKLVDQDGNPLVMYHGTHAEEFTEFRPERLGTRIFVTTNPEMSDTYTGASYEAKFGRTYPLFVRIEVPLIVDAKGAQYDEIMFEGSRQLAVSIAEQARREGYDGVIFHNLRDALTPRNDIEPSTVAVVFSNMQVKSATGNNGNYDIFDEDIRFAIRDLTPRTNIAPDQSEVEKMLIALVQDTARADAAFNAIKDSLGGRIIGTDVARFLAPEYATKEGRLRHTISTAKPASAYADDRFTRAIEKGRWSGRGNRPLLLGSAGGVASGKSYTLDTMGAVDLADLVLDTQFRDHEGGIKKIQHALDNGWKVRIVYVQRPFDLVVSGAISLGWDEGRWGSVRELPKIHRGVQVGIAKIAEHFSDHPLVTIEYRLNEGTPDNPRPIQKLTLADIQPGGRWYHASEEVLDGQVEQAISDAESDGAIPGWFIAALAGREPPSAVAAGDQVQVVQGATGRAPGRQAPGPDQAPGTGNLTPFAVRPEVPEPRRDLLGRPIYEPATGRQQDLPLTQESEIERQDRERKERQARANGDDLDQQSLFAARSPEFMRWFGDSKVVDRRGNPLIVYHGTPDARFMRGDRGSAVMRAPFQGEGEEALFFASNRSSAVSYARDKRTMDYQNAEESVLPVYLRLENPMVIDAGGTAWGRRGGPVSQREQIAEAKRLGHDGIIIRNTRDNYNPPSEKRPHPITDVFVVFRPDQVKSATNNSGAYSKDDPDIRFAARAPQTPEFRRWFYKSVVVDKDGNPRVMYHGTVRRSGFTVFDTSTSPTEIGSHFGTVGVAGEFTGGQSGVMYPVYLSIRNPIRLGDRAGEWIRSSSGDLGFGDISRSLSYVKNDLIEQTGKSWYDIVTGVKSLMPLNLDENEDADEILRDGFVEYLKSLGYDGVVYANRFEYETRVSGLEQASRVKAARGESVSYGQFLVQASDAEFQAIFPESTDSYIVFDSRQVKSATGNNGQFSSTSDDIRFAVRAPKSDNFWRWFGKSKVVDADGKPLMVSHGSRRPDRIGSRFLKSRATSGPMAFFSDNTDISSNYATQKQDTSIEAPADYAEWFQYRDGRSTVSIDRAWGLLSADERATVMARFNRVTDSDNETGEALPRAILLPEGETAMAGADHWAYVMQREARGNPLRAMVEVWLSSGNLFEDEERFMGLLAAAGIDRSRLVYNDPNASYPGNIPVYLRIENPLNTAEIPEGVVAALRKAGRRRRRKYEIGVDHWDKNSRSGPGWMAALDEDIRTGQTHAWTSIPDWVTATLKDLGYDGIQDTGGKMGGVGHTVWIPFEPEQVKSVFNQGNFDPSNPDIRFAVRSPDGDQMNLPGTASQRLTPEGRPDLANPGVTPTERGFVNAVDEMRNNAGQPRPTTFGAIEERAKAMTARDPQGVLNRVRDRVQRGESLTAEETIILSEGVIRQIGSSLRNQDAAELTDAIRITWQYRQSGTVAARALGIRRDPVDSPRQRYRDAIMNAMLFPSPKVRQKLERLAIRLSDPGLSEQQRRVFENQQTKLFEREGRKVERINQDLAKAGINPAVINQTTMADPTFAATVVDTARRARTEIVDALYWVWLNNILSGLLTHAANLLGNTGNIAWRYGLMRPIESTLGTLTGGRASPHTLGEYGYMMGKVGQSLTAAYANMIRSWTQNRQVFDDQVLGADGGMLPGLEIKGERFLPDAGPRSKALRIWGLGGFPLKALMAEDQFFKGFIGTLEAHGRAYSAAKAEGLTGDAVGARVEEILADWSHPVWKESLEAAKVAVFQDDMSKFGEVANLLRREVPGLRWILPFVKTPDRLFVRGFEASPIGLLMGLTKGYQGKRDGDTKKIGESAATAIMAMGVLALVALMKDDDDDMPVITGSRSPSWRDLPEQYRTAPPMSIRIGGKWYSYARIEPISTGLALTVDFLDRWQESGSMGEATEGMWKSVIAVAENKTFLQSLGDILEAVRDPERSTDLISGQAKRVLLTSWVPNIVKQTVRETGGSLRDTKPPKDAGWWSKTFSSVPYELIPLEAWGDPPRHDIWGRPINRSSPFGDSGVAAALYRMTIPIQASSAELHPMDRLVFIYNQRVRSGEFGDTTDMAGHDAATGEFHARPPNRYFTRNRERIDMTADEYQSMIRDAGQRASERLIRMGLDIDNPDHRDVQIIHDTFKREYDRERRRIWQERQR